MSRKTLLTLSVSVTLATISLAPTAVFAQFPGPLLFAESREPQENDCANGISSDATVSLVRES